MADSFVLDLKCTLRRRLCSITVCEKFRDDLKPQLTELTSLLQRTVEYGESNSLLVVGMKGSGKSALVQKALKNISSTKKHFLAVQLNGLLQTDDRVALEEITRQLQLENTVGDKVFGSFAETLSLLLQALRGGKSSESTPILFILDEFDLFAQHKNQTLLYNLFDIVQAGLTPMAVVGVTCRIDVMDLLEKRVKSRFSHRQTFICNMWSFEDYVAGFTNLLQMPSSSKKSHYTTKWNTSVEKLAKDHSVLEILKKQYYISKEIPGLQKLLMLPVGRLNADRPYITPTDISDSARIVFHDSKLSMLLSISVLELCLIIAMNHLTNIFDGEPFNFQMVYNEFLKFSQKKSHILHNYTKPVVYKAFEHLVELELLLPKDTNATIASRMPKDFKPMVLLITQGQLKEAIDKYPGCPTDVKRWADSSLL